ncbi:MAG: hypothetical protein F6K04_14965 [Leptolyngbya sp. SIO4C5]|nr:hypothetical protein [Leptolyngbya sp. SIO4C5]
MNWRQQGWRYLLSFWLILGVALGGVGCSDRPSAPQQLLSEPTEQPNRLAGGISEVSPPETVQSLGQLLEIYQPQVKITAPRPDQVFQSQSVSVRLQVQDLPLFKDEALKLGPHLHLFLDDQPYQAVYDASQPVTLTDLSPGTHTLRVFASRPWHESFKNQGAYDQLTFHIYAKTPTYQFDRDRPLLTYSRPQGSYGAEPIMLDFYINNVPLHMIAQEDTEDDIPDWRIRCSVNGQSFIFDQWQPIYLKGFKPGKNWVQLELIDEQGRPIANTFNNTVRVIDYQPGGSDTLSQLVRDELDIAAIKGIIDPTYEPPAEPEAPPAPAEPPVEPIEPEVPAVPETPPPVTEPEATEPEVAEPVSPVPAQLELSPQTEGGQAAPNKSQPKSPETDQKLPAPEAPDKAPLPEETLETPADFRLRPVPDEPPASEAPALEPEVASPDVSKPSAKAAPETLEPAAEAEIAPPAAPTAKTQGTRSERSQPSTPAKAQPQPKTAVPTPEKTAEPGSQPATTDEAEVSVPAAERLPKSSIKPELPEPSDMPVEIIEGLPSEPESEPAQPMEPDDVSAVDSRQFFNRFRRLRQRLIEPKLAVPDVAPEAPAPIPSALEPPLDAASSPSPEQPVDLPTEVDSGRSD